MCVPKFILKTIQFCCTSCKLFFKQKLFQSIANICSGQHFVHYSNTKVHKEGTTNKVKLNLCFLELFDWSPPILLLEVVVSNFQHIGIQTYVPEGQELGDALCVWIFFRLQLCYFLSHLLIDFITRGTAVALYSFYHDLTSSTFTPALLDMVFTVKLNNIGSVIAQLI